MPHREELIARSDAERLRNWSSLLRVYQTVSRRLLFRILRLPDFLFLQSENGFWRTEKEANGDGLLRAALPGVRRRGCGRDQPCAGFGNIYEDLRRALPSGDTLRVSLTTANASDC
jgi:hypothetical protein